MGKTFAYNTGKSETPPGVITLTHGMFFDGTKNSRRNTEIRKKIEHKDEYENKNATEEEKSIYRKYAMERTFHTLWIKKEEIEDSSYQNDFSNVARASLCCKNIYTIYIEGIGTTDEKSDSTEGYAWGRGGTGIHEKVKKGCKLLADKVKDAIKNSEFKNKVNSISIVLDVFGFSRGAAAARNFVYNLQKSSYAPKTETITTNNSYSYGNSQTYTVDHDGYAINNSWVSKGVLPAMGHFGTILLDAGLDRELVDKVTVSVRFLGVYDTVASYDPVNILPNFEKYVKDLHLHDLGSPQKAVHFTAMDEYRKNFSLTRLKSGIERNFPGVHSDIGGSYDTGDEILEDIKNKWWLGNYWLYDIRKKLISEYWFKEDQIEVIANTIATKRSVYKHYSFLLLHFMRDYSKDLMKDAYINGKIDADYPITHDILVKTKDFLQYHTIEEGKDWQFVPDDKLNKRREEKRKEELAREANEKLKKDSQPQNSQESNIVELDEIVVTAYSDQKLLRLIRNEYLHWSARRELGMEPNSDGKRREF